MSAGMQKPGMTASALWLHVESCDLEFAAQERRVLSVATAACFVELNGLTIRLDQDCYLADIQRY